MKLKTTKSFDFLSLPRIEKKEAFFFISYGMMILYLILSATFYLTYILPIWRPLFFLCLGLLAIHEIISNQFSFKMIMQVAVVFGLFIALLRVVGGYVHSSVAWLPIYLFCARKITFRKIASFTFFLETLLLIFVIFSAYTGIITNYLAGTGPRRREFLGFLYPLYAPAVLSNITLLWIYLKKERMKIGGVLLFFLANLFLFRKTDSRLCFFLTVLMLFFGFFLKKNRQFVLNRKLLLKVMVCSFLLTFLVSIIMIAGYNPSVAWQAKLNITLGRRLSLAKESLNQYGVSLFGNEDIRWMGNALDQYGNKNDGPYLFVDNYYVNIMQKYGIVLLAGVLALMTYASWRCYQRKELYLLSIFTILAAHFVIDNLYMYIHYNTFWFAAGIMLFNPTENGPADLSALNLTDGAALLDSIHSILPVRHTKTRLTFGKERKT